MTRAKSANNRWLRFLFVILVLASLFPHLLYLEDGQVPHNGNILDQPTGIIVHDVPTTPSRGKESSSSPSSKTGDGFGACLIIMDDNHFLIEWLAYHSYVLPLKHLIVAVDPKSRTSPRATLDKYLDQMTIQLWGDDDFMLWDKVDQEMTTKNMSKKAQASDIYVIRQRMFYSKCMATLQHANRSLVAMADTDEFIVANPNAFDEVNLFHNLHLPSNTTLNTTIWGLFQMAKQRQQQQQEQRNKSTSKFYQRLLSSCLPMSRLQFSTHETTNATTPEPFHAKDFLTLQYQHHFGLKNFKRNGKVKSIMDLSQIPTKELLDLKYIHAHLPVRTQCKYNEEFLGNRKSPIVAHHYVGSWEQWTFRDDPRSWTRKKRGKYDALSGEGDVLRHESAATTWLDGFIQQHGVTKAKALLKDVGYVPSKTKDAASTLPPPKI